jgi:hypothetical protein
MKTIKFSAKTKDGIIFIPKKYQKKIINPVNVILRFNGKAKKIKDTKKRKNSFIDIFFNQYHIDLSNYKFDRNEANER